jgi:hypothetical protein
MLAVHGDADHPVLLELTEADGFAQRCPDVFMNLVECSGFVNLRFVEHGQSPILALVFID